MWRLLTLIVEMIDPLSVYEETIRVIHESLTDIRRLIMQTDCARSSPWVAKSVFAVATSPCAIPEKTLPEASCCAEDLKLKNKKMSVRHGPYAQASRPRCVKSLARGFAPAG